MNKKMTPKVIRMIALQSVLVIIAVTVVGGAVITHDQYKNTGNPDTTTSTQDTTSSEVNSTQNTTVSTTQPTSADTTDTDTTDASASQTVTEPEYDKEKYPYGYAGFLPEMTDTSVDISRILVNGKYSLPEDYKPTLAEAVKGSGVMLDYRVAPYYQAMYDAAKADGITLTPVSGYRSFERQKRNFENRISENMQKGMDRKEATIAAATVIMVPGSSEHNAGLAMDICSLSDSFENTKEFEWLNENAANYGFILRYPKDAKSKAITGVVYEPWHYRFVGIDTAKDIKAKGVTLEEYLGKA